MSKSESLIPLKMLLFCFHAANTIILSFLPLYLKYKGLNGAEIGYVLAMGPLATIIAQPFWGYLSDKYKTVKKILIICIIGLIIGSIVFFQMNTLTTILLMGAVFYFFTTPIGALGDSLAQRRAEELNVSFGNIRTWGSIGFAVSSLAIGTLITDRVEWMIYPYLFFGFLALFVSFRLKDVTVDSEPVKFKDIGMLIRNKPFLIFLFLIIFITVGHRTSDSYIGLYIEQLGGNEFLVGLSWFIGVASEAIIFFFAGYWFKKFHPLVFVIIAGALYTLRWFLYSFATDPIHVISLQFLHGVTFGVFYLAAFDYVSRLIPKLLQSTGHLVFFSVFFGVSGIIGSLTGGVLIDTYGGGILFFVIGCLALIGTILMTIYHVLPYGKKVTQDASN